MNILVAAAVGYVIGARSGRKDLDQVARSLKKLCGTEEFADVVTAARSQLGTTLRELATVVDGNRNLGEASADLDLVAKVRRLVGND